MSADRWRFAAVDPVRRLCLVAILVVVVLTAVGANEWLGAETVALTYLLFGGVVFVQDALGARRSGGSGLGYVPVLGLTLALAGFYVWVFLGNMIRVGDYRLDPVVVFLAFVVYPFVHPEWREHLSAAPLYVAAGVGVVAAHFYFTVAFGSTYPVYMSLIFLANLFVVPRHLSREGFLSVVSRVAAAVVLVGAVAYVVGPYHLWTLAIDFFPSKTALPLGLGRVPLLQSVFGNPNTLGAVTFVGAFAALVELDETTTEWPAVRLVPATLLAVNLVGLYLTHSRAAWVAAAVAAALYLTWAHLGEDAVGYVFVGATASAILGLVGIYLSLVPVPIHARFELWGAGLRTVLANPSVMGRGLLDPAEPMASFVADRYAGYSPHNAYLVVAIRTGLVGLAFYVLLTVGSVVDGALLRERLNTPMLGLAAGFVVQQSFEATPMIHRSVPPVLGALAVGYLVTNRPPDRPWPRFGRSGD